MKIRFWIPILAMNFLIAGFSKMAASQEQPSSEHTAKRPSDIRYIRVHDSKRQLARLSKKLKLTSEQKTRVEVILSERDRQIELIQGSEGLTSKAKTVRIGTIVVDSNVLVESVLSGRQKQKYEEALARQLGRKDRNRQADSDDLYPLPQPGAATANGPSRS
jgi:hypothetical protein